MKVRFRTNLGTRDALHFGLDHAKCQAGSELEVSDDAAESLADRGLVEKVGRKKSVKAVPKKPAIAESKESTIVGDKKEDKEEVSDQ